jgi:hypothetical protein
MPQRVRIRREAILLGHDEAGALTALVDEFVANEAQMATMAARNNKILLDLDERMKRYGLKEYDATTGKALYVTPKGKATNTVSPAGFKELVSEEDFLACISVSVTKATLWHPVNWFPPSTVA